MKSTSDFILQGQDAAQSFARKRPGVLASAHVVRAFVEVMYRHLYCLVQGVPLVNDFYCDYRFCALSAASLASAA